MSDGSKFSTRRQFIKDAGLVGAASVFATRDGGAGQGGRSSKAGKGKSKSLIFLVADGLSAGSLGLAHRWKLRNRGQMLNWMQLFGRKDLSRALQDTASASSPVTDSAAASSAWSSGLRVNNGSLNIAPDGTASDPLFTYAKNAGKATGLVSTCRLTHATPAGFAANVPIRGMEDAIARQYLDRGVDVLLGGGLRHFQRDEALSLMSQEIDLIPEFEAHGYQIVRDKNALKAVAGSPKLLGLFADGHIPYAMDRRHDDSLKHVPGLAAMFRAALSSLGTKENGFVLQVEGGRVDHASHANDPAATLHELLEFDACIPIALEFLEQYPDTLLIITTDHGTGGCQLNGKGLRYVESGPVLDSINQFKHSFEWLQKRFTASGTVSSEVFKTATGIELSRVQSDKIQRAIDAGAKHLSSTMTDVVKDELWEKTAVGWTSRKHTAECVDLMALGPGARSIPPFLKSYQLFGLMTEALGLERKPLS